MVISFSAEKKEHFLIKECWSTYPLVELVAIGVLFIRQYSRVLLMIKPSFQCFIGFTCLAKTRNPYSCSLRFSLLGDVKFRARVHQKRKSKSVIDKYVSFSVGYPGHLSIHTLFGS